MKKNILIHAVGANTGGGLRHLNSLVAALAEIDHSRNYEVLIRESIPMEITRENIHITRIPDHQSSGSISRIYFDIVKIPQLVKKHKYSCVISLMNFGPIFLTAPHIIYQCNVLYYSDLGLALSPPKTKIEILARRFLAGMSMKHAKHIITPSESTKAAIREKFPHIPSTRFKTLYHGFDSRLFSTPLSKELRARIESRDGVKLFYPASLLKHKAFDVLIDITKQLEEKINFTLFLTIKNNENSELYKQLLSQIDKHHLNDRIVILGNIPQSQMGAAYELFDLMVFPSLLESFGMPLLEAMAYNCPIVASDTAINRETCGDAALFYPPLDAKAAAEKIQLALQSETRNALIEHGRHRILQRDWSWQKNAETLLGIIAQLDQEK